MHVCVQSVAGRYFVSTETIPCSAAAVLNFGVKVGALVDGVFEVGKQYSSLERWFKALISNMTAFTPLGREHVISAIYLV